MTVPDEALVNWLKELSPTFIQTLKARLYKTNITIAYGTVFADFVEADFTGYAAISLAGFSTPATLGHSANTAGTQLIWTVGSTPTTTNNIYGVYITDASNTKFYGAVAAASAPIAMAVAGATTVWTPSLNAITQ